MLGLGGELMADAAIGGGMLFGLFGYNRGNYMYDASFRFERFSAAREFACAQAEMYRGDLRALSALTAKKNTMYSIVASLCMALCVALYCAGRLGLHGPSPPAWIMGLWYTNNAAAFSFMALAIWLATHAAFRAQSASVSLLTRKIRVPVPSLKQLDQARKFASEFEQQSWGDIFRVPYISNNGAPKTDEAAEVKTSKGSSSRSHSAPAARRSSRASSWVREEFETDRAGTITGSAPMLPADAAPEHFRLYLQAQKEWFAYDVYARVAIILGLLSLVHALGYYGLGHINIELRAFWVAHATGFVLMVCHALLLRFDIIRPVGKKELLPHCQWLGPIAWVPAAIGMSLDFRVEFSLTAVAICWVCIFLSYILQFIYTLRLIEIVLPDDWRSAFKAQERIGATWWPESWHVPSSFQHVLYLVAPPLKLQPGQHDLYREVKEGLGSNVEDAGACPSPIAGQQRPAQENLFAQMQYVDSLFEWAFQDAVLSRLSNQGKSQLRQLFDGYHNAKNTARSSTDSELPRICRECVTGINAIVTEEGGLRPLSSEESGYDTAGSAHSPMASPRDVGMSKGEDVRRPGSSLPVFAATQHVQPWRLVTSIVVALAISWVFLILGCIVDVILGEQALVTAPHWSRPPMTRRSLEPHELGTPIGFPWAAGSKPWIPEQMAWHEEKRQAERETLGARRLAATGSLPAPRAGLSTAVAELMAVLRRGAAGAQAPGPEPVTWPAFFEPQLLACGPAVQGGGSLVAALTPRGFGATAHVGRAAGGSFAAEKFALAGVSHLPPLLGASWGNTGAGENGLTLVSRGGHLLSCPGPRPTGTGAWACEAPAGAPSMLPVAKGARLAAAAAAWLSGPNGGGGAPRLHAAFVDEAMPELVAMFVQDGEGEAASWLPLGEIQVPGGAGGAKTSLAFAGKGDLLLTTSHGALLRRRLSDGTVVASAPHGWGARGLAPAGGAWQAACSLEHGPVAHLHLRKEAHSHARRPDLVAAAVESMQEIVFQ